MPEPVIWAFTTAYWHTRKHAEEQEPSLQATLDKVERYFAPRRFFIACGTWSEPNWSPMPMRVPVINSGAALTKPYEPRRWCYSGCALTAAMAYALTDSEWNLLVILDTDVIVGAVDFDAILREFLERPEELVGSAWKGHIGMPLAWKREGAARWLHQRKRANLVEDNEPVPMWIEEEYDAIYKGRWWNAWPSITTTRQEDELATDPVSLTWPFVRGLHPSLAEAYKAQTALAKPVRVRWGLGPIPLPW